MLYNNNNEKTGIFHLGKAIQSVFHLGKLVWQAIRSCFGLGAWRNDLPWSNDDAWSNG